MTLTLEWRSEGACALDRMAMKRLWQYAIAATEVSTRGYVEEGGVNIFAFGLSCNNEVF